ncbi:MAG: hypothetical protein ACYDA4_04635 [Ignavibacteriaceae bacterium]
MVLKEKYFEVLGMNGEVILRLRIREEESFIEEGGAKAAKAQKEKESGKAAHSNGDPMTDAQKKYLFRIYAEQGTEASEIHAQLKKLFGVDNLKEVSKVDASREIDRLLKQPKGGNGNGSFVS